MEIQIGDHVKSYDFPLVLKFDPEQAEQCFAEGIVEEINTFDIFHNDHLRYKIAVTRRIWAGKEDILNNLEDGGYIYPPINGLKQIFTGGVTSGVIKL